MLITADVFKPFDNRSVKMSVTGTLNNCYSMYSKCTFTDLSVHWALLQNASFFTAATATKQFMTPQLEILLLPPQLSLNLVETLAFLFFFQAPDDPSSSFFFFMENHEQGKKPNWDRIIYTHQLYIMNYQFINHLSECRVRTRYHLGFFHNTPNFGWWDLFLYLEALRSGINLFSHDC